MMKNTFGNRRFPQAFLIYFATILVCFVFSSMEAVQAETEFEYASRKTSREKYRADFLCQEAERLKAIVSEKRNNYLFGGITLRELNDVETNLVRAKRECQSAIKNYRSRYAYYKNQYSSRNSTDSLWEKWGENTWRKSLMAGGRAVGRAYRYCTGNNCNTSPTRYDGPQRPPPGYSGPTYRGPQRPPTYWSPQRPTSDGPQRPPPGLTTPSWKIPSSMIKRAEAERAKRRAWEAQRARERVQRNRENARRHREQAAWRNRKRPQRPTNTKSMQELMEDYGRALSAR